MKLEPLVLIVVIVVELASPKSQDEHRFITIRPLRYPAEISVAELVFCQFILRERDFLLELLDH